MSQFSQRFGFDLADTFARNIEEITYFFERVVFSIFQSKTQLEHFTFTIRKRCECALYLLTQHLAGGGIHGRWRILIFDEIAKRTGVFIPYWTINGNRFLGGAEHTVDFQGGNFQSALQVWRKR